MRNNKRFYIVKHAIVCLILAVCCEWISWHPTYVSLIEKSPQWFKIYIINSFSGDGSWYNRGDWKTGFYIWTFIDMRLVCFFIMLIIFIIINFSLKYRIKPNFWKSQKWFIIIPASLIILEFIAMLTLHTLGFVSISIVGWYVILNTIFEPIPMFKKSPKQTPISSNA